MTFEFFASLGSGQPFYPGYFKVIASGETRNEAESKVRAALRRELDNRWCMLYASVEALHPLDRTPRGLINADE